MLIRLRPEEEAPLRVSPIFRKMRLVFSLLIRDLSCCKVTDSRVLFKDGLCRCGERLRTIASARSSR
jgi:hypothetical protein